MLHSRPSDRFGSVSVSDLNSSNLPVQKRPSLHRYETMHLDARGDIVENTRLAPAHRIFEDAFSAFARGAILRTQLGPRAIEDVLPGDIIQTANGWAELRWKGAMLQVPGAGRDTPLIRLNAESLGFMRPQADLVLGPAARILHRSAGLERLTGHKAAFASASEFCDGVSIVETRPAAPVQVFHLGFDHHEVLNIAGVEVESYHPGEADLRAIRGNLLDLFMSIFPHKADAASFGPLTHPRISLTLNGITKAA